MGFCFLGSIICFLGWMHGRLAKGSMKLSAGVQLEKKIIELISIFDNLNIISKVTHHGKRVNLQ